MADERKVGRVASQLAYQIVKVSRTKLGVVSRHARKLRDFFLGSWVLPAIQEAFEKTLADTFTLEFDALLKRACPGDREECKSLQGLCKRIIPSLPSRSGRPLSYASGIQILFVHSQRLRGDHRGYTYKDFDGDYTDPQTHATRLALSKLEISRSSANYVMNSKLCPKSFGLPEPSPIGRAPKRNEHGAATKFLNGKRRQKQTRPASWGSLHL